MTTPSPTMTVPTNPRPQSQRYTTQDAPDHMGDCYRTSIAILLGLDRDEVPHFVEDARTDIHNDWWTSTIDWLAARGWGIEYVGAAEVFRGDKRLPKSGWLIATGHTRRSYDHYRSEEPWALQYRQLTGGDPIYHAVVMRADLTDCVDPHPDGTGLTAITGFYVVTPVEPHEARP